MSLDASLDSFDSIQIPERSVDTDRTQARERRVTAERKAHRDESALFRMAIDRPGIDELLFGALMTAVWVIVTSGVAWAMLPLFGVQ